MPTARPMPPARRRCPWRSGPCGFATPGEPVAFKRLVLGPVHTSINPRFRSEEAAPRGVARPEEVARYLANSVLSSRRAFFYYPWTVGAVGRFGGWLPDALFERLTRPLRR